MLIGNYKIESDSLDITVFEKMLSKKSGENYWKPIGYFSNVQNALKFMVDLEVNKTELKDFRSVSQKQEELYQLILSLKSLPETPQSVRKPLKNKVSGKV